jgi:nitrite reductase/ring-hydroxylating ferredoxin subunit
MNFEEDGFQYLCLIKELKENIGKRFLVNDVEIAVFKIGGEVFALNNVCPHQQTHLIYDGFIEDDYVVCPAHGWKFNIRTGKKPTGSNGLDSYLVNVVDDKVYVKVFPKKVSW